MRPRLLALVALALLAHAAPALADPVFVSANTDSGSVGVDVPVVAFSYDVKQVFPAVAARFERWRPVPPTTAASQDKLLPELPNWTNFHLVHAAQLQDYRESFQKAHASDRPMMQLLMPRFDNVYRKYGDQTPDATSSDVLAPEDSRKIWCQNVTHDLNAIISAYNASLGGGDAANARYRETYARWLGSRNEALRQAVLHQGGQAQLGFVESAFGENGSASFDLPPGRWYFACQLEALSWYKPVNIPRGGGRVALRPDEANHQVLGLAEWVGS